jgi:asparagine synthase (glutamine-hydrolysing)
MCGVCGVVSASPRQFASKDVLHAMCRIMYHRGPDDEGYYEDAYARLGMRRLSIIDLATGQQPISNEDKTLWLVFNGEVYNYQQLRRQLEGKGHVFSSESDTEVIVHAYEEYGDRCVEQLNGMFGFALWDAPQRRLLLARDRLGIKPLYYWADGHQLVFGSELKALIVHPDVPHEIDPIALDQFLTLEYILAPRTILNEVRKLPPGHRLIFQDGSLAVEQYWDIPLREISENETVCAEMLSDLINDAVRLRLMSDVPLGAFLSGGIDSSTIVTFMSRAATDPIQTFSIGFDDETYDELPYARQMVAHVRAQHREEILSPDIAALAERLVGHLDEPLGDFSIFPTYLVSRLASCSVKVVLSGDGGDEIFGGYDTYVAQYYDHFYRRLPTWLRQAALPAMMAHLPPQSAKKGTINKVKRFVEGSALPPSLQHTRWMIFLADEDKAALYRPDLSAALNGASPSTVIMSYFQRAAGAAPLVQQQYVDIKTYLVDNILTKVDRMSMAASIEARVPFLDHRIVEFAVNLPPHMKLRHGQTKLILRRAMADHLPVNVLNKPKQGFSIPLKNWLRGPLRPMMLDLLSDESVRHRGYFQPQCVTRWVSEHLDGRVNHSHRLWALMVFELWSQKLLETVRYPHRTSDLFRGVKYVSD